MKKVITITLICLVLGLFLYFQFSGKKENPNALLEFAKVSKGELIISVKESGYLNSVEEEEIKNEHTSKKLSIIEVVENGTFVEKGDLLVELDSAPLEEEKFVREEKLLLAQTELSEANNTLSITKSEAESAINKASSEIDFAQIDLTKFKTLDKTRQLEEALAEIATAKDELKLSEQTYTATLELAEKGFETKSKVERDKLDLSAKQKTLGSSEAKYEALKEFDLVKESLELERALSETKASLDRAKRDGDNKVQRAEAKVRGAEATVTSAQEALTQIQEEISQTKIYAPITGYALYPSQKGQSESPQIAKGQAAFRNQTLLRIPNMSDMKIDVQVAEHLINDLQVGQKAVVTIDSLKDQTFGATVSNVALMPASQSYWTRAGTQKYTVVVNVNDAELPDNIKPQISASTEIFIERIQDALFVPVQAVHTEQGKQVVYLKANNEHGCTQQIVQIGKMNTNNIQIISGLKEGDEVLISEP